MTSPDVPTNVGSRSDFLPLTGARASAGGLESFMYDDGIVRSFMLATFVWGLVGMLVGLLIALQLAVPALNASPFLTCGPLRPLQPTRSSLQSAAHRGGS